MIDKKEGVDGKEEGENGNDRREEIELIRLCYQREGYIFRVHRSEFQLGSVLKLSDIFYADDLDDIRGVAADLHSPFPVNAYLFDKKRKRAILYSLSLDEYNRALDVTRMIRDEMLLGR